MRAVVITRPGGPEVLEIRDTPAPTPASGEMRVRVRAFGINRADLLQRRGLYPAPVGAPKDIPGLEYAGEVERLGPGVDGHSMGDRVMGIVAGGAYAELVVTPAAHSIPVPAGMSFSDAAAIPEAFLTAHDALEQIGASTGEWILIHAVGSGVGTAAVQLAGARGARVIGTSRTRSKLERAAALGLDAGIDMTSEGLVAAVRQITGGLGADAALDLVGGPDFAATLEALAPRGRVILIGLTAGSRAAVDLGIVLRQRLRIVGTVLRSRSSAEKTMLARSFREKALPLFMTNAARPVVDRVLPLERVREAHEYVESNANFGKVVVHIP
jgi:putative PIG3 family NAD(P)H quinone oxidoreductase